MIKQVVTYGQQSSALMVGTSCMPESPSELPGKMTPQVGFGTLAGIISSEAEQFLQAVLTAARAENLASVSNDYLLQFLRLADEFARHCCGKCAAFLHESSSHAEVRETPELVLVRLVRNRCFESLDLILLDYVKLLQRLDIELMPMVSQLADSRLRDGANTFRRASQSEAAEAKKALLPQTLRTSALLRVIDYLRTIQTLPQQFLDYGASKLFGGDLDFTLEQQYLQTIRDNIQLVLDAAIGSIQELPAVKERLWEQKSAAESAAIKAVARVWVSGHLQRKSGLGLLVISAVCAAPGLLVWGTGLINRYTLGVALVSGIVGICVFVWGIIRFAKVE